MKHAAGFVRVDETAPRVNQRRTEKCLLVNTQGWNRNYMRRGQIQYTVCVACDAFVAGSCRLNKKERGNYSENVKFTCMVVDNKSDATHVYTL